MQTAFDFEQGTRDVLHFPFHYYWLDRIGYFEKVLSHVRLLTVCQPVFGNTSMQTYERI